MNKTWLYLRERRLDMCDRLEDLRIDGKMFEQDKVDAVAGSMAAIDLKYWQTYQIYKDLVEHATDAMLHNGGRL